MYRLCSVAVPQARLTNGAPIPLHRLMDKVGPAKTVDAALRLLPDTRQVFVIAGRSRYDLRSHGAREGGPQFLRESA